MINKDYIVTNFAYGTGPYLRTTDLALAFNDGLRAAGQARLGIIVPWVYGEKQKKIMLEEFAAHQQKFPGEILLDEKLGSLLRSVFYADSTYEEALRRWSGSYRQVSEICRKHLSGPIEAETLAGEKIVVDGLRIRVELSRSPRLRYDVAPAYLTTFGYIEEILTRAMKVREIKIDRRLLGGGATAAKWVESRARLRAVAYPATFDFLGDRKSFYNEDILVPPIAPPPVENNDKFEEGIFVTITGIPGLERLYGEAHRLGLKLYSNDPASVAGSIKASPHIIPNKKILLQFARAGWSSIWTSMISGTPLLVPDFDANDDPEIYFNNLTIEKLGLGVIYRGQSLEDILATTKKVRKSCAKITSDILKKWGTLDGNRYAAELFAKDFLATLKVQD